MIMPTVLCYGDSNTYGAGPMAADGTSERYGPDIRWPRVMAGLLGPGWHVIEEGLPGRTTCHDNPFDGPHKNGLRLLPAMLESHAPLDLVVLMLGTNDLKAYLGLTAYDIAKGLRTLIALIQRSAAGPGQAAPAILLIAPAPINETGPSREALAGGAAKSRAIGPLLKDLAQALGCGFLDAGAFVSVSARDGVHLDPEAHPVLAAAVAEAVTALL